MPATVFPKPPELIEEGAAQRALQAAQAAQGVPTPATPPETPGNPLPAPPVAPVAATSTPATPPPAEGLAALRGVIPAQPGGVTSPPPSGPASVAPVAPPPSDPAAALAQREAALAVRERQLNAREQVAAQGLPAAILDHLDYSSDDGLSRSLTVAKLAAASFAPAPLPIAGQPPGPNPKTASYLERAQLFQTDPATYQNVFGGK